MFDRPGISDVVTYRGQKYVIVGVGLGDYALRRPGQDEIEVSGGDITPLVDPMTGDPVRLRGLPASPTRSAIAAAFARARIN